MTAAALHDSQWNVATRSLMFVPCHAFICAICLHGKVMNETDVCSSTQTPRPRVAVVIVNASRRSLTRSRFNRNKCAASDPTYVGRHFVRQVAKIKKIKNKNTQTRR